MKMLEVKRNLKVFRLFVIASSFLSFFSVKLGGSELMAPPGTQGLPVGFWSWSPGDHDIMAGATTPEAKTSSRH